jgi:hypothetical protein
MKYVNLISRPGIVTLFLQVLLGQRHLFEQIKLDANF